MAAPPEVPDILGNWIDIIQLIRDEPKIKLASLRLSNYRKDAQTHRELPGGRVMTEETYNPIVGYVRPFVEFPICPVLGDVPELLPIADKEEEDLGADATDPSENPRGSPFDWCW